MTHSTDVFPALTMVYEKPEADLLARPPRDTKKDQLADARLLCHAYLFIGIMESELSLTSSAPGTYGAHSFDLDGRRFLFRLRPQRRPLFCHLARLVRSYRLHAAGAND